MPTALAKPAVVSSIAVPRAAAGVATASTVPSCTRLVRSGGGVWRPDGFYDVTAEQLVRAGMGGMQPFSPQSFAKIVECWRVRVRVGQLSSPQPSPPPPPAAVVTTRSASPPPSAAAVPHRASLAMMGRRPRRPAAEAAAHQAARSCKISLRVEVKNMAPCTFGKSFGCYPGESKMWVSSGCRGTFWCNGQRSGICGFRKFIPQLSNSQLTNCSCHADPTARDAINAIWWEAVSDSNRGFMQEHHVGRIFESYTAEGPRRPFLGPPPSCLSSKAKAAHGLQATEAGVCAGMQSDVARVWAAGCTYSDSGGNSGGRGPASWQDSRAGCLSADSGRTVCSGHGVCFFGACVCQPGWEGAQCASASLVRPAPCVAVEHAGDIIASSAAASSASDLQAIRARNKVLSDGCLRHPAYGSALVPEGRWKLAQAAEAALWRTTGNKTAADLKKMMLKHLVHFGWYSSICNATDPQGAARVCAGNAAGTAPTAGAPAAGASTAHADVPKGLGRIAELGSGLWTQAKLLTAARPDLPAVSATLIDPGIPGYLSSGSAGFRSGTLNGLPVELLPMGAEQVPSCYTHAFDTVVMINVIEHTFNAFATLETAHRLLKPGGLFLFAERVVRMGAHDQLFHPVRLTVRFYDAFLSAHFDEVRQLVSESGDLWSSPPLASSRLVSPRLAVPPWTCLSSAFS